MENGILGIMIGIIILVSVGISVMNESISQQTSTIPVINESFANVVNNTNINLANSPIVVNTEFITNSSSNGVAYVRNVRYRVIDPESGTILWLSNATGVISNWTSLNVTYSYYPTGYIGPGVTQIILWLVPLFLAVTALILFRNQLGE